MPAEYIDFELRPQHIGPYVLERAGLSIAAIVKQSGERSCRRRQHMLNRCGDRLRFGIVETVSYTHLTLPTICSV